MIGVLLFGVIGTAAGAPAPGSGEQPNPAAAATLKADSQTGYLEDIRFERAAGKERVIIMLSRQAGVQIDAKGETALLLRIPNTFVPEDLRKPLGQGSLASVLRAFPSQGREDGKPLALITIDLPQRRPYLVKQEGNNVVIDFQVGARPAGDDAKSTAAAAGVSSPGKTVPAAGKAVSAPAGGAADTAKKEDTPAAAVPGGPKYTGQKISIDFHDADLRAVLRLLGEQAGKSIVTSPEVKGTITISMQQVPWDQILDTILDLYSLTMREEGSVITILSLDKAQKDEKARQDALKARKEAEEAAKKAATEADLEKGKLRQLMIEAKILEVNETFIREIGVRWGGGVKTDIGNGDYYSLGLLGGTYPLATPITKLNTGVALTRDALALSMGSAMLPSLGIIMGGANAVLQAQIAAIEENDSGRVLSSPRVLTQDKQKATIEQGEEIPLVTPATANNPATTTYRKVPLTLEVTPQISSDNHILLTILAKNERVNRSEKDAQGNYPFYTSKVDSKILVKDGDTIVIGGITRTEDTKSITGVPWLSQIPFIGWLFKYEEIQKVKRELLIFVTPRIIKAEEAAHTRM